jgi:hypothetical protein
MATSAIFQVLLFIIGNYLKWSSKLVNKLNKTSYMPASLLTIVLGCLKKRIGPVDKMLLLISAQDSLESVPKSDSRHKRS